MRNIQFALPVVLLLACGTTSVAAAQSPVSAERARPLPYPIDLPRGFQQAIANGTRSTTGVPGPTYWQNWSRYTIRARLDVANKRIDGTARIVYLNRSPKPLPVLALQIIQNVHAEGVVRNRPAEVTGGMEITRVVAQDRELRAGRGGDYVVLGTALQLRLPRPLAAGDSTVLELDFGYRIPQEGAGGRMGWSRDNLFYLAYWYPQMAVFDDVGGWQTDAFLGNAEFYMGYGDYDVTLEVPEGWLVLGTGRLTNAQAVLPVPIMARLAAAQTSDTVVHVLTAADFGPGTATRRAESGALAWRFAADSVRDVAYSITRQSLWDAARTPVGDRDGDGGVDYTLVSAVYRETAPVWASAWRYAQHSIAFLSRWTGYPYPWPHMTAVEGEDIIGGGMEYPMMTLIGGASNDRGLYGVTAHELAHMWVPMIVGNDERRHAWMDEGTTSFNGGAASNDFYGGRSELGNYQGYLQITRADMEGPIMTWSDYHTNGWAYGTASYAKPATLLWTLRGLLGPETFAKAYHTYIRRWAFKHPQPWDLFNTFSDVSGQNLEWFWRSWYYETWTLDQAVQSVRSGRNGTTVVVEDRGRVPMPARLTLTLADGATARAEIPVDRWLTGARRGEITVRTPSPVVKVEIDAEQVFPDADRGNNVWTAPPTADRARPRQ
ncbi:MAG: M1 family metallopeptidase [Gemmatimonadota bacterium]|nr:M1 family metallopeptidase [Gemmatimonadota bacterium]